MHDISWIPRICVALVGLVAAFPAEATTAEYVGSAKCKLCHSAEFKAWEETTHANAFTNLKAGDQKDVVRVAQRMKVTLTGPAFESAACVICHVTGYGLAGGYPATGGENTAAVAAVGCESCHGPGSLHVSAPKAEKKKFTSKTVPAKLCLQCHTPAVSPEFNYEEMLQKGAHPKTAG